MSSSGLGCAHDGARTVLNPLHPHTGCDRGVGTNHLVTESERCASHTQQGPKSFQLKADRVSNFKMSTLDSHSTQMMIQDLVDCARETQGNHHGGCGRAGTACRRRQVEEEEGQNGGPGVHQAQEDRVGLVGAAQGYLQPSQLLATKVSSPTQHLTAIQAKKLSSKQCTCIWKGLWV